MALVVSAWRLKASIAVINYKHCGDWRVCQSPQRQTSSSSWPDEVVGLSVRSRNEGKLHTFKFKTGNPEAQISGCVSPLSTGLWDCRDSKCSLLGLASSTATTSAVLFTNIWRGIAGSLLITIMQKENCPNRDLVCDVISLWPIRFIPSSQMKDGGTRPNPPLFRKGDMLHSLSLLFVLQGVTESLSVGQQQSTLERHFVSYRSAWLMVNTTLPPVDELSCLSCHTITSLNSIYAVCSHTSQTS